MSGRFTIDLLHPGRVAATWRDWFVGTQGRRRLIFSALGCLAVLIVLLVASVLPTYFRLSGDLSAIPRLRRDLAARDGDLNVLRADLGALSLEAKRQVRWAELLNAFSQQVPPTLKLLRVEALRGGALAPGAPPAQQQAAAAAEATLKIEAVTPQRAGSPPLLEIAQFMAGLMKDPAVSRRFQLRSWEIRPLSAIPGSQDSGQALQVTITLSERAR